MKLFKHKHLLDFSNYPKKSKFFDEANKRKTNCLLEFVGLNSKTYSIKNIDGKETNTEKGVNIATKFNEFKDSLFNKKILKHKMRRIQVKKHKLGTYETNKTSLSCFDDKRPVSKKSIHTQAYVHKDLRKKKNSHGKEEILTYKKDSKDFHKKKRFSRIKKFQNEFS